MLCSGCGTIVAHTDQTGLSGSVNHGLYRGVRTDWDWLNNAHGETSLGVPLYFVDMPFSLVFDTVFLPLDAILVAAKSEPVKTESK